MRFQILQFNFSFTFSLTCTEQKTKNENSMSIFLCFEYKINIYTYMKHTYGSKIWPRTTSLLDIIVKSLYYRNTCI